jgi:hypothetical protein
LILAASIVLKSEWQLIAKNDVATKSQSIGFDTQIGSDALGAPIGRGSICPTFENAGWDSCRERRAIHRLSDMSAALAGALHPQSRHGEKAEHDQQENHQHHSDEDTSTGCGCSGQPWHSEQTGHGGDNDKNEYPMNHSVILASVAPRL